ncbi:MAG TPA: hypothetical protein VGM98_19510, partial [Schlesneria sp.]
SIALSIQEQLDKLPKVDATDVIVKSRVVQLPLQDVTKEEVAKSIEIIRAVNRKEKVEFLEHVAAYKKLMLDHFRHRDPFASASEDLTWGFCKALAGVGDSLPVDVTVIAFGHDLAIVYLPGEVFVELGLAIKQASPFRATMVVELTNAGETIYIPNRAAYAGGSYEVTNSTTKPGSGEMLVEAAISLLREAASTK